MKINDFTEARFGLSTKQRVAYGKKVTSTELSDIDAALEEYQNDIVVALEAFKNGNGLYRGLTKEGVNAMLVDPTKVERKAANTYNFMNIMQAHLPSWKGFAPRNRSLICSTSYSTASMYSYSGGRFTFAVLPFGNPVIGIVPGTDWFASYTKFGGPQHINRYLADFYNVIADVEQRSRVNLPETKVGFFKAINEMDAWCKSNPEKVQTALKINPTFKYFIKPLIESPSWIEGLNTLLDPNTAEFKKVTLSQFKTEHDREVWVNAPALLVNAKHLMNKFKLTK